MRPTLQVLGQVPLERGYRVQMTRSIQRLVLGIQTPPLNVFEDFLDSMKGISGQPGGTQHQASLKKAQMTLVASPGLAELYI